METKRVLAFDFGASSGRAMIAELKDGKIEMKEIHRFANDPVLVGKRLSWDILRLYHEIKQGIVLAVQDGGFDAIGIDTWGVDFGLINRHGELIGNPANYRDTRTEGMPEEVYKIIPESEIYSTAGIQKMNFNTLYQLYYLAKYRPEVLAEAETFLMIPDLFAYFLTGKKRLEYTNASTTNILDAKSKKIDAGMLERLGIKSDIFPEMIFPGEAYGNLLPEICEELHCESVPVIAVPTHDTASAVYAVPTKEKDYAYISCGTWSLFGTVVDEPILSEESRKIGFTNEGAHDGKIRYLRNIMGLWLIQQSRGEWKRQGLNVSFDEMENSARAAEPFKCFVNPDAVDFVAPGNMPKRVTEFCKRTGQFVPETMGEVLRCIYQSLAMKYRLAIEEMQSITGKKYECIYMIGGGIKDKLLCQLTADACGIKVMAGPVEATVTGNIVTLFGAFGLIENETEAKDIIINSTDVKTFMPENTEEWAANAENYKKIL
ncbi:MAG: rhamnulokinase [Clostridia bacterium]|nr:rhamnulokinase [Clostridia bacterium]